jgi:hypothetical protein
MRFISTYALFEHNTTESPYFLKHLLQAQQQFPANRAALARADEVIE